MMTRQARGLMAMFGTNPDDPAVRTVMANALNAENLLVDLINQRQALGVTRDQVAAGMGVDPDWLRDNVERLGADPLLSTIKRYAAQIGVVVEYEVVYNPNPADAESTKRGQQ